MQIFQLPEGKTPETEKTVKAHTRFAFQPLILLPFKLRPGGASFETAFRLAFSTIFQTPFLRWIAFRVLPVWFCWLETEVKAEKAIFQHLLLRLKCRYCLHFCMKNHSKLKEWCLQCCRNCVLVLVCRAVARVGGGGRKCFSCNSLLPKIFAPQLCEGLDFFIRWKCFSYISRTHRAVMNRNLRFSQAAGWKCLR